MKKSIIEKYLFDNELLRLQDYDLVLRMFPSLKISFTNETLINLYIYFLIIILKLKKNNEFIWIWPNKHLF